MRRIAVLAINDVYPGSLATIVDLLRLGDGHIRQRLRDVAANPATRTPVFSIRIVAPNTAPVMAFGQWPLAIDETIADSPQGFDAVVIPAIASATPEALVHRLPLLAPVYAWLLAQHQAGAVLAAHHSGIFLLAEAGLLQQHSTTVPIGLEAVFRQRYPRVKLDLSRALVDSGDILCSAPLAAATHLACRLAERFASRVVMSKLMREVFLTDLMPAAEEPGTSLATGSSDPLVERAQYWLLNNLTARLPMSELARQLSVSERTLFRRFKKALAMTPLMYLQSIRLETAKSILERTSLGIAAVALRVGYGDSSFFSEIFTAHVGCTPGDYRKRHRLGSAAAPAEEPPKAH